ncbi:MAG TPA: hypothetical protein VEB68_13505 [Croceibacterium sp.]|nr:hypothetical protein [Croceibacterium sp.]
MVQDPIFDPVAILVWGIDAGVFDFMNSRWGWPIAEIVHFTGICLLIGAVGMFDLRMVGLVRGLSLKALHRLVPFGVLGFGLSAASGLMFVVAAPDQYLYNPAWQVKMALLAVAGLNMALFYLVASRRVALLGPDDSPPVAARLFAAVSLASWFGVIAAGRVITAFRPPSWFWCAWCA